MPMAIPKRTSMVGVGMAMGMSFGVAFGTVFGNIPIGLALGLSLGSAFGLLVGAGLDARANKRDAPEADTTSNDDKLRPPATGDGE